MDEGSEVISHIVLNATLQTTPHIMGLILGQNMAAVKQHPRNDQPIKKTQQSAANGEFNWLIEAWWQTNKHKTMKHSL